MTRLVVSGKEVVKVLVRNGFGICRQKGSHVHLTRLLEGRCLHVTVPVHDNDDLAIFVLHNIARQAGYSFEEFVNLF